MEGGVTAQTRWQHKETNRLTLTDYLVASQLNVHAFGLWKEAAVPGKNPKKYRENAQTPDRKTMGGNQTHKLLAVRRPRC